MNKKTFWISKVSEGWDKKPHPQSYAGKIWHTNMSGERIENSPRNIWLINLENIQDIYLLMNYFGYPIKFELGDECWENIPRIIVVDDYE